MAQLEGGAAQEATSGTETNTTKCYKNLITQAANHTIDPSHRYCFLEMGRECGHLQDAEYSVLCKYYELVESQLDIGIDLIGKSNQGEGQTDYANQ